MRLVSYCAAAIGQDNVPRGVGLAENGTRVCRFGANKYGGIAMAKAKHANAKKASRAKKGTSRSMKTIGILHSGTQGRNDQEIADLMQGLRQGGYPKADLTVVGPLFSNDDPSLLGSNAATFARDTTLDLIIAAGGTRTVYAIKNAQTAAGTKTDVVFTTFSESSAPAPNMTGVNAMTSALDVARLQILRSIAPTETTFGVLENQTRPDYDRSKSDAWAANAGVSLDRHSVFKNAGEADQKIIDRINAAFDDWRIKGIRFAAVCADPIFYDFRSDVIKGAKGAGTSGSYHIRSIYQWLEFGGNTGDLRYGPSLIEAYQTAGKMAAQVLDLADPSDIATIPVVTLTNIQSSGKSKPHKGGRKHRL
jgi:hypothetical protein